MTLSNVLFIITGCFFGIPIGLFLAALYAYLDSEGWFNV